MSIEFPPRNESLDFFKKLNQEKYGGDDETNKVDIEGIAVWMQEYLRFRVNGRSHLDACVAVFQAIDQVRTPQTPNPPTAIGALIARGPFFAYATGDPFTAIECSDFNLLNRSEAGEQIDGILAQRAACGFNLLRVWTAYDIPKIGRLVPRERPGLYAHLPAFAAKLAQFGLLAEFTAFTGPYPGVLDGDDAKVAHYERLCAALQGVPCLFERVNEGNNTPNRDLPWDRLPRPQGLMASPGSALMDQVLSNERWGYLTWHGPAFEWQRKIGHGAQELWNGPVLTNETPRYPDNEQSLAHAFDGAAGAALLCAGSCFHSVHGKTSERWEGLELEAAWAWAAGARSVPLGCQGGDYRHRSDLESGDILRAYQRGNEDACIVRIRA